jgi:hypothetical protein
LVSFAVFVIVCFAPDRFVPENKKPTNQVLLAVGINAGIRNDPCYVGSLPAPVLVNARQQAQMHNAGSFCLAMPRILDWNSSCRQQTSVTSSIFADSYFLSGESEFSHDPFPACWHCSLPDDPLLKHSRLVWLRGLAVDPGHVAMPVCGFSFRTCVHPGGGAELERKTRFRFPHRES